jgi:DedD protein
VSVDLATSKQTAQPPPADAASVGSSAADANSSTAGSPPNTSTADVPPASSAPTVTTLRAQESAAPSLETQAPSPKSADAAPKPAAMPTAGASVQARHAWAVQLGSFASKANAEKLVHQLQASAGSSVYVLPSGSGASARYRVRVGPLSDRNAAERAVARLKSQGHPATIVTPTSG